MLHLRNLPPSCRPQVLDVEMRFLWLVSHEQVIVRSDAAHGSDCLKFLVVEEDAIVGEAEAARRAGHG